MAPNLFLPLFPFSARETHPSSCRNPKPWSHPWWLSFLTPLFQAISQPCKPYLDTIYRCCSLLTCPATTLVPATLLSPRWLPGQASYLAVQCLASSPCSQHTRQSNPFHHVTPHSGYETHKSGSPLPLRPRLLVLFFLIHPALLTTLAPLLFLIQADTILPQGLCTCYFSCLESSSPRYAHESFLSFRPLLG